jgi:hypothetical protein
MGILSNLFGTKKKSNAEVFILYTDKILDAAEISKTDANKLKVTVYLLLAQLGILNVVGDGKAIPFLDKLAEDAKDSIKNSPLIKIKDLARNDEELEKILSDFPASANLNGDVKVNGLAAFEAIYFSHVEDVVSEIANKSKESVFMFATIKLLEAMLGKEEAASKFLFTSFVVTEMTGELIKGFR